MPKHKKRMKLPNNFGSIKYLGKGRRRPYGVYPPVTEWTFTGPVSPKALAYTETWEEGYEILTAYNMEKDGKIKVNHGIFIDRTPTFSEVYQRFFQEKYHNSPKKLSKASMDSTRAAFQNCSQIHGVQFGQLRYEDLQGILNGCPLKHSSLELIISLLHQMYKYAMKYEIVDKDYSAFLYIPKADDDTHGEPFTEDELKTLWENKGEPTIGMLLIMCYSGFRISAFTDIEVSLKGQYFKGGVKTKSSKKRTVPIHPAIRPLVENRYDGGRNLLSCSTVPHGDVCRPGEGWGQTAYPARLPPYLLHAL